MSKHQLSAFEHPESMPLSELLRIRMAWLPYLEFAMCVARILRHLDYTDIPVPSRLSFKGANVDGGADLRASKKSTFGIEPVIVQLKRYKDGNRSVPRSAVDELRGKLLRDGVPEGVGFTTTAYSDEAKKAAAGYPGKPVRLIEGAELGELALACRIGVLERSDPVTGQVEMWFDELWFERLSDQGNRIREAEKSKRAKHG